MDVYKFLFLENTFIIIAVLLINYVVWSSAKAEVSRVFTDKYKSLRTHFPNPLKTIRFLCGDLSTKSFLPFQIKGILKLDVYDNMLIVSSMGQALRINYNKYTFEHKKGWFFHYLIIKDLSVQEKKQKVFLIQRLNTPTTTLTIQLSKKNIDFIGELIEKDKEKEAFNMFK